MYAAALHAQFIRSPNLAISKYAITPFLFFVGSAVSAKELISSLLLLQIFQFYEGRNVFNETHTDAFKRCPQSENSDTNGSAKGASETCAEIWIDGIRDCATEAPNALLGNQSSSEWNIGPAENFHRARRGILEPFANRPPLVKFAFAEQSVCDRIAFARSESSNRTARRPSGEKRRTAESLPLSFLCRIPDQGRVADHPEIMRSSNRAGMRQR